MFQHHRKKPIRYTRIVNTGIVYKIQESSMKIPESHHVCRTCRNVSTSVQNMADTPIQKIVCGYTNRNRKFLEQSSILILLCRLILLKITIKRIKIDVKWFNLVQFILIIYMNRLEKIYHARFYFKICKWLVFC